MLLYHHANNNTIKLEKAKSNEFDLDGLIRLCKEHQNNPTIGYLNINSLRNKTDDLRQILLRNLNTFIVH